MKKTGFIFAGILLCFLLQLVYLQQRVHSKVERLQSEQRILQQEMEQTDRQVQETYLRFTKLRAKIRRPLIRETNYKFACND